MLPARAIAALASLDRTAIQRRAIEAGGLLSFARHAWPQVEAGSMVVNENPRCPHHAIICDALERISRGELRSLILAVPPGTTKTLLTGVFWEAWDWLSHPERRMIHTTYGGNLALKAARQSRTLVNSAWYEAISGRSVAIPHQNTHAAAWFETNAHGSRFSGSVGGEVTGRHAHILVGDDLNKAQDIIGGHVASLVKAGDFWFEVLPTRQADPKTTARVLIGQRLHYDDVPGQWMRRDPDVEVIAIPMRGDPSHPHRHPLDTREEGELLWPERFGDEEVAELEASLGPTNAAAQLQQLPIPPGGLLLTSDYLSSRYEMLPSRMRQAMDSGRSAPGDVWRVYGDLTFKGKPTSDFVVYQLWARHDGRFWLVDQVRGQWGFRESKQQLAAFLRRYPVATAVKLEDAANAPAMVDDMRAEFPQIQLAPMGGGCLGRTQQVEGIWSAGSVMLPEHAPWMGGSDGFVAEHLAYDGRGTRHDDQVATSSLALLDLSGRGAVVWADTFRRIA